MSGAPPSLPHVLSGSCCYCIAGYAIPRSGLLHMPQLARPLGSSNTALVLATNMIQPLDKRDPRTTGSQVATDPAAATHNSP
jgi:hypothetical protein